MKLKLLLLILFLLLLSCEEKRKATDSLPKDPLKKDGLYHLRTTSRIAGDPYGNFVNDAQGNIYLAAFEKKEGSLDRILIAKLSPLGDILWEKGQESTGRAQAITISPEGKIWVCGFFQGQLSWDGKTIASKENAMFWARLDQEGKTEYLEKPEGAIIGTHLHTGISGDMLLVAEVGESATIGGMRVNGRKDSKALVLMDNEGKTKWVKALKGNVKRIISDANNTFWLGGDFKEEFFFEQDSFRMEDRFDRDGFLIRIGKDENWTKRLGHKGIRRFGYSPFEGVSDLTIGPDGSVLALITIDDPETQDKMGDRFLSDVGLYSVSDEGEIRLETVVTSGLVKGQVFRMAVAPDGQLWISGNGIGKFTLLGDTIQRPGNQAFLIGLDPSRRSSRKILPSHGPNTIIRDIKSFENQIYASGHYSSYLKIGRDSLQNQGTHALFFYRKYLPTL